MKDIMGFDFKFEHLDKNGNVKYSSEWLPNQLSDEGFEQMFDIYFRGQATVPNNFQVGLAASNPSQTTTIATVDEVSGAGYERQDVNRDDSSDGFPGLGLDTDDDMMISATQVTFENTSTTTPWTTATDGFISAVMSGTDKFVCWRGLGVTRTLEPGDELRVTMRQKGIQP